VTTAEQDYDFTRRRAEKRDGLDGGSGLEKKRVKSEGLSRGGGFGELEIGEGPPNGRGGKLKGR